MMSNKRLAATCAIAFCCNVALLVLFVKYNGGIRYTVNIDETQEVVNILPEDFLSFGIDTAQIENFNKINYSDERLIELAEALSPARLRLGGTSSERLIFSKDNVPISCGKCNEKSHSKSLCKTLEKLCKHKFLPFFIMTGNEWNQINNFCKKTNLKLLFSLNAMLRDEHGTWNDRNAKEIIEFSKHKNYSIDWQLGNEPNSYKHVFNETVSPQQLAHDFEKVRKILNHSGYNNSLLVGPDTTRPQSHRPECLQYMVEFLGNGSQHIDVRSWHQYYLNSKTARLDEFWNPNTFDLLKQQIVTMKNHTKKYNSIPMWLSETSSAYGGGAPELSNTYAGSPLWLDKLGLSAKYNITTVIRQSFIGGNYSLVDENLNPLPDWWISVLFKKLVGGKVLHAKCTSSRLQRLYIHCTNRKYTNDTSAVTLYAINLEMAKARFVLNGTALHGDDLEIDEYIISPPSNNRKSKTVLLNGWPLRYESNLRDLQPYKHRYGRYISLPPYSIGFWVIKKTSIKVCK